MKYNLLFIMIIFSCKNIKKESNDWLYLFDGTTTNGWRAYNNDSLPSGWIIDDGALTFNKNDKSSGGDIIYSLEEFENFELYIEWKLPPGGNSGIFYHVKEGFNGIAEISPEYQLIDDINYSKIYKYDLQEWQKTAADYAMYTPDTLKKILNPIGEWNTSKIRFTSSLVEHWLNDKKVLSFVPWSDDWYKRKSAGKWKNSEKYGSFKKGYIGLQDHDSPIWFKNIKILKLD